MQLKSDTNPDEVAKVRAELITKVDETIAKLDEMINAPDDGNKIACWKDTGLGVYFDSDGPRVVGIHMAHKLPPDFDLNNLRNGSGIRATLEDPREAARAYRPQLERLKEHLSNTDYPGTC